jgi:CubicO group peptidase (beta-lactamase class C family)
MTRFLIAALGASAITIGAHQPAASPDAHQARIARIERDIRAIGRDGTEAPERQTLAARMAALKVPGISVAVFDEGQIIWTRGYGIRDNAPGARVDDTTLFQAASISKPVSAVAMFRLIEQGQLSLDEDVNARLRSWKVPDSAFTSTEKVTLRRIVSHMSGLGVHGFRGYDTGTPLPTLPQILDGVPPTNSPAVRVEATPGERESYSGGGFTVLQLLMEDVTRRPFADLLDELVLRPAQMTRSTFAQPLPGTLADRAATGFTRDGTPVTGRFHVYPERAAAGLWTTPSDLARFMLAVGRSYRGEPDGILQKETAQLMLTPVPRGSGLGFGLSGDGPARRYRHSGGNAGFSCYAVAFTDTGRGVVLMTNSDNGTVLMQELARAIAREYGWPYMWTRE